MKEQELTELECMNEYFKQRTEDNGVFSKVFNLGKQSAFSNQHVQIKRIEGQSNTNDFLSGIPRENIIGIKPMEHNTYLVIYTEEEHEESKV